MVRAARRRTANPRVAQTRAVLLRIRKAIRRRRNRGPARIIKEDQHRINRKITSPEVRLVGENIEIGVYKTTQALEIADEQGLDLVEISPKAIPPVCKVMDFKFF